MSELRFIRVCRPLCIAAAMALTALSAPAATVIDIGQARASLAAPAAVAVSNELETLAARGSTVEIVAVLRERVVAGQLNPIAREALLERGLQLLAALPGHRASRALAAELASRPPQVFVRSDPEQSAQGVPFHDVGAVARFAQRSWIRSDSREATAAAIRAGRPGLVEAFAARAVPAELDPEKAGALEAFTAARDIDLLGYRAALIAAADNGGHADELLFAFAQRLRDAELFERAFDRADAAVAVRAIGAVPRELDGDAALAVLVRAAGRNELASAALLSIADLARTQDDARRLLFSALRDPANGPSAAAALGKLRDAAVASELGRTLDAASDETTRRHVALALQFDGSPAARRALERFAKSGKGSRELRKEVDSWLARD